MSGNRIHRDTHVVLWLHANDVDRLSPTAVERLNANDVIVSPMVDVELTLLHESGRTGYPSHSILDDLAASIGLRRSTTPFADIARTAATLSWTRDPFDRLIAADALVSNAELLTKDRNMREHLELAIW